MRVANPMLFSLTFCPLLICIKSQITVMTLQNPITANTLQNPPLGHEHPVTAKDRLVTWTLPDLLTFKDLHQGAR